FALPTELWHRCLSFASANVGLLFYIRKHFAKKMRIFCENMFFCTIFALVNNEKVCFYAEMLIFYSFFITFAANDEIHHL
ncbi:MAG: hypothetical protein J6J37_06725, partial [Bacteroidaceae bacterium]|nr:hypothetical protein [Bacteroidaceae bacterium]